MIRSIRAVLGSSASVAFSTSVSSAPVAMAFSRSSLTRKPCSSDRKPCAVPQTWAQIGPKYDEPNYYTTNRMDPDAAHLLAPPASRRRRRRLVAEGGPRGDHPARPELGARRAPACARPTPSHGRRTGRRSRKTTTTTVGRFLEQFRKTAPRGARRPQARAPGQAHRRRRGPRHSRAPGARATRPPSSNEARTYGSRVHTSQPLTQAPRRPLMHAGCAPRTSINGTASTPSARTGRPSVCGLRSQRSGLRPEWRASARGER
eukprot:SAG11_NODE_2870_length_2882_cov_8.871362_1_plen_261_part_00